MSSRPYFLLLAKMPRDDWAIQFGDFERDCVVDELNDAKEHEKLLPRTQRLLSFKIIRVANSSRKACDDAIAQENAR